MYVNSTAFFNNSLITNNYAGGYGGALVTDDKANINFVNTQFILNKALVRRIKNDIVVFLPYFFVWLLNSNIHRDVFFFECNGCCNACNRVQLSKYLDNPKST